MTLHTVPLKGGGRALPIRVEYLLDAGDLATVLAFTERNRSMGDPLPELSRVEVMRRIRETVRESGAANLWVWGDYMSKRGVVEVQTWADATIDRTLGDLFSADQ